MKANEPACCASCKLIGEPLHGQEDVVASAAVSSDGQRVVSCSRDMTIRIWSVRTGKEVMDPLRGHDCGGR